MIEALGDPYLQWDAAYVLGSLSSADRREFEAHMQTCDRCRAAVAELSGIPALLSMLDADEVDGQLDGDEPEPPPLRPEVLDSVLDKVKWRRRRSRWMTSAAVGLAAAVLAVGLVIAIRPGAVGM
ncbi:zf-HC2 domain-containing protein, partial [Mycolicibacterium monacense]